MVEQQYVFREVKSIIFGMLSPKMIKQMSSIKVVTPELYDKEGYPVDGGLMDIRMGVIDPAIKCKTCGSKLKECTGHFGHIELARPIMHIKYAPLILNILRSICNECTKPMVEASKLKNIITSIEEGDEETTTTGRTKRTKGLVDGMKSTTKCPHCNAKQEKITIEKPTTYFEGEKRLSPIEIRTRLEKISDDDIQLFGLNPEHARPEWMILTLLAIPPVTMRPSITLESGERSEDDLTHKLGDIVRINQRLFENINAGAPEIIVEDLWDLLQYHVTTFFDNAVPQLPPARHRSGQPLKTITERIKSKEGRIRHNLAGKRTNFSARTVISPDPMLEIYEVGVPLITAMKLTVPEKITEWNIKHVKEYVKNGPKEYPGANYIIRPDEKKKKITDETKEQLLEEIEPGYSVERHLLDGDIALFNRQPSLHRMSMMCHRVRVLPGKTLRLNPAVCAPYNADFDGDEMNLHIPQTEEARAEAEILMQVQTQLISPRYGLSIIGCNQDALSGNYLLTSQLEFSHKEASDILYNIGVDDFSRLPKKDIVTGKELISCLFEKDFNFTGKSRDGNEVIIKNGKLIKGILDKANLGEGSGLLLRMLIKKYGEDKTILTLGQLYRLGIEILLRKGFTIGLADTDLPQKAEEEISQILAQAQVDSKDFIKKFHEGTLEVLPGKTAMETLELRILELLNKARDNTGRVVAQNANQTSPSMVMVKSGARGNIINLAQMAACVGQQALSGGRIGKGYKNRTLSHFKENDLTPDARGFIKNNFKKGLAPAEFFFGAMTGRDSLMDTALRTPKSGYLYRRLANALQDLKVNYDHTVRDANNKIVQFKYGGDGVDVSKSEGGVINVDEIIKSTQ
ncbi:DNA-directed RNA polymerase subunit A' [Candidatus Woesearchaeota archaeon]|nr:DNA-directed RNA polymerase subunit A' [Candidatus Woesearchaeota archaeon]